MSVFVFFNKTRGITHEKENDKAGPDQPTEEVEETIYGTHPRNETKKGREGNTWKRQQEKRAEEKRKQDS